MEVRLVAGRDLAGPLKLLERSTRNSIPLSAGFVGRLREEVERGSLEVLVAHHDSAPVGVLVLAFRPSVSAGGCFASIEELYVEPEARRRGAGRMLLEAVEGRCASRGVSYVEVQTEEEDATSFYRASGYDPEAGVRVLSRSVALRETRPGAG